MTEPHVQPLTVCYLIQTHAHPHQVVRLVRVLRTADPDCEIYLSHDRAGCDLPAAVLDQAHVYVSRDVGGRGRFENVDRWSGAARWLQENNPVDFLVTLTGQDYPIRPVVEFHQALQASGDGLMEHFPALRRGGKWPLREGRARYLYSWHDLKRLEGLQKDRLRPLLALNRIQPLFRVNVAFDNLRIGLRASSPFHDGFSCYGGSFFTNLSWRAVKYVMTALELPEIDRWMRRSLLIEEAIFQSILVSSGKFNFLNTSGRYYDFSAARHGSPATLTADDVPAALSSGQFFARKWHPETRPETFDRLDEHIGLS